MYLKTIIDPYVTADGTALLKLRITLNRVVIRISHNIRVRPDQFNKTTGRVKRSHPQADRINVKLSSAESDYQERMLEADQADLLTPDLIRSWSKPSAGNAWDFIDRYVASYSDKESTHGYKSSMAEMIRRYAPKLSFVQITDLWMKEYHSYLKGEQYAASTISNLLSFIRSVCRMAYKEGLTKSIPAYSGGSLSVTNQNREPVSIAEIRRLSEMELTGWPELARDIFIFQLHGFGMRIGDAVMARTDHIKDGYFNYVMRKTGDPIRVKLTKSVLSKIDFSKPYIFNFPLKRQRDFKYIKIVSRHINKDLKVLLNRTDVTSKFARITWSQLAKDASNGNMRLVQDAMGHASVATTERYAGGPNFDAVNELNEKIWGE